MSLIDKQKSLESIKELTIEELIETVADLRENDKDILDEDFLESIIESIGQIGGIKAKKVLFKILKDKYYGYDIRGDAAEQLTVIVDQSDANCLIRLLKNNDPITRENAAFILGQLLEHKKIPRTFPPLIQTLNDNVHGVVCYAADALGNLGDTRAVNSLLHLVGDTRKIPYLDHAMCGLNVHTSAINALGKIGDPEVIEPLIKILTKKQPLFDGDNYGGFWNEVGSPIIEALMNIGNRLLSDKKLYDTISIREMDSQPPEKIQRIEKIGNTLLVLCEQNQKIFRNKKEGSYVVGSPEYNANIILNKINGGITFWAKLAKYYYYNQDYSKALLSINIATEQKTRNYFGLLVKGKILQRLGRKKEAIEIYQNLEKNSGNSDILAIIADLYDELGEKWRAELTRKHYRASLSLDNMVEKYRAAGKRGAFNEE